jgi:hypothetical protein
VGKVGGFLYVKPLRNIYSSGDWLERLVEVVASFWAGNAVLLN